MFERFDADCRRVVGNAHEEARELGCRFIGTEHFLLALLEETDGHTAAALDKASVARIDVRAHIESMCGGSLDAEALLSTGIDLERVRDVTEARFGPGALERPGPPRSVRGHLPLTKRAKTVLELSVRVARQLSQNSIRADHLMLAVLEEGGGMAVRALEAAHVDVATLHRHILDDLHRDAA